MKRASFYEPSQLGAPPITQAAMLTDEGCAAADAADAAEDNRTCDEALADAMAALEGEME